jgi:hypothetical protein
VHKTNIHTHKARGSLWPMLRNYTTIHEEVRTWCRFSAQQHLDNLATPFARRQVKDGSLLDLWRCDLRDRRTTSFTRKRGERQEKRDRRRVKSKERGREIGRKPHQEKMCTLVSALARRRWRMPRMEFALAKSSTASDSPWTNSFSRRTRSEERGHTADVSSTRAPAENPTTPERNKKRGVSGNTARQERERERERNRLLTGHTKTHTTRRTRLSEEHAYP